jgi:hypothetical protein
MSGGYAASRAIIASEESPQTAAESGTAIAPIQRRPRCLPGRRVGRYANGEPIQSAARCEYVAVTQPGTQRLGRAALDQKEERQWSSSATRRSRFRPGRALTTHSGGDVLSLD